MIKKYINKKLNEIKVDEISPKFCPVQENKISLIPIPIKEKGRLTDNWFKKPYINN